MNKSKQKLNHQFLQFYHTFLKITSVIFKKLKKNDRYKICLFSTFLIFKKMIPVTFLYTYLLDKQSILCLFLKTHSNKQFLQSIFFFHALHLALRLLPDNQMATNSQFPNFLEFSKSLLLFLGQRMQPMSNPIPIL